MLDIVPVTPERWPDMADLFGSNGAYANCWCMWWRVPAAVFDAGVKGGNRAAMERLVADGAEPGLLAYDGDRGQAVGWVSVADRAEFGRVLRSPVLKPVDDQPAWSVVCFFIPRRERGRGVGHALLAGAVEHARARGAALVEGYPESSAKADSSMYTGTVGMFERAGFVEAARRKPGGRVVMRLEL